MINISLFQNPVFPLEAVDFLEWNPEAAGDGDWAVFGSPTVCVIQDLGPTIPTDQGFITAIYDGPKRYVVINTAFSLPSPVRRLREGDRIRRASGEILSVDNPYDTAEVQAVYCTADIQEGAVDPSRF